MEHLSFYIVQFLNGLTIGMTLFLIASGVTLILGVLGLLNLCHGSFYMLGAFLAFTVCSGKWPAWFWISLFLAPTIAAIVGTLLEILFLRRIYNRERFYVLLFTFAWVLVFDDLVLNIWGREFRSLSFPPGLGGSVQLWGKAFPIYFLFIIFLGVAVILLLWALFYRTKLGLLIRACAQDSLMLNALGKNVSLIHTSVFALGTWLAALGGVVAAPLRSISAGMGLEMVIESFIVVVIGGMGSIPGALIGALLIGQIRSFGILILPQYAMILIYILLAGMLIVRPRGIFGYGAN